MIEKIGLLPLFSIFILFHHNVPLLSVEQKASFGLFTWLQAIIDKGI